MRNLKQIAVAYILVSLLLCGCHKAAKTTTNTISVPETTTAQQAPTESRKETNESSSIPPETTKEAESRTAGEETTAAPSESAAEETTAQPSENTSGFDGMALPHPVCPSLEYRDSFEIPEYEGQPYIVLNDGVPFFDTKELKPEAYECYYDLDELGRCTLADAVAGRETMPTEKRGNISSVKPTGWRSSIYPQNLVDGGSLYNRCHLIAFGLCGENANPYNLVTGTRYFNTKGVNDFENMVIDYIRETGCHVRYRVTPLFVGEELVCRGQILEAWSIEDEGDAISICIYSFNVQPGIEIDYLTGENWEAESGRPAPVETTKAEPETLGEDMEGVYVLNVKKLKIHKPNCSGATGMSEKNREEYSGSLNELLLKGYTLCPDCLGAEEK